MQLIKRTDKYVLRALKSIETCPFWVWLSIIAAILMAWKLSSK